MDIGARLKQARLEKNLSLDYLQETTKIQKRYLTAIEEGNFKILPGKFYAKAFIKEYANAVGLDPNELLEHFYEEPSVQEEEKPAEYTRVKQRRDNSPSRSSASILPKVTVVLLIVAIVVLAIVFYSKTASDSSTDPVKNQDGNEIIRTPQPDEDKDSPSGRTASDEDEGSSDSDSKADSADDEKADDKAGKIKISVVEEGSGSSPESVVNAENAGEKIKVAIKSEGNSWLEVRDGEGAAKFSDALTKEKSPLELEFDGEKELYFIVGNAPDLTIKINGQTLDFPVDPDQKVFQKIRVQLNSEQ